MAPVLNSPPLCVEVSTLSLISGDFSSAFRLLETFLPFSFAAGFSNFEEDGILEDVAGKAPDP